MGAQIALLASLLTLIAALIAACPIPQSDVPAFGQPCDGACAKGYFCDAITRQCLPGEAPAPPNAGVIDSFTADVDDVRPDADVVFTWQTTDTVSCALGAFPDDVIETSGSLTKSFTAPGDVDVTLACAGADGEDVEDTVTIHVRNVHAGDLVLGAQPDVVANATVEEVDGDVLIVSATVASMAELELRAIHGSLVIDDVAALLAVELASLEVVDGSVIVASASSLNGVSFPALTTIGAQPTAPDTGDFIIKRCDALATISVPNLVSVGGAVAWSTYDYPDFPAALTPSPAVLPALTSVAATSLATIGGYFDMEDADALVALSLPALTTIGGAFVLWGNDHLQTISLPFLDSVGGVVIDSNANFDTPGIELSIDLGSLREIHASDDFQSEFYERFYDDVISTAFWRRGDFRVIANARNVGGNGVNPGDNSAITALDISSLETSEGGVYVLGTIIDSLVMPVLRDVKGLAATPNQLLSVPISLPALTHVGVDGLFLPNSDILQDLSALVTVDGDLHLGPQTLEDPLTALTTVGGDFNLDSLAQAEIATGFPALTSVGTLSIEFSTSHTDIPLCSLTTVGTIDIEDSALQTINGLANVTAANSLRFVTNTSLPACFVADLAVRTSAATVNNTGNNAAPATCTIDPVAVCPP